MARFLCRVGAATGQGLVFERWNGVAQRGRWQLGFSVRVDGTAI